MSQATNQPAASKLFFTPVHPLNFPARELLAEAEQPSAHWSGVTRIAELYEDMHGMLCVTACFRPAAQPGNIDNVRCYMAPVGPRQAFADPRSVVDLGAAGARCEEQMLKVLRKVHGAPQAQAQSA
jgi:hypothetical protein